MSSAATLSLNDTAVLGALFDPEASLSAADSIISGGSEPVHQRTTFIQEAEQEAISALNVEIPSERDVHHSIAKLTNVIDLDPSYASAYANRAQARRLLPGFSSNGQLLKATLSDLDTAIDLASPRSPLASVSQHEARVLSQAHTHRGYLFLKAATSPDDLRRLVALNKPSLAGVTTSSQLEELASRDLGIAGRYGNDTARQLAVKTNPYAKLCGQIVKEILQREIVEFYGGHNESECA